MIDELMNRRLHEITGLCWHDFDIYAVCMNCNSKTNKKGNINFLTWEGFGVLWEWLQKHERFSEFVAFVWCKFNMDNTASETVRKLILLSSNPDITPELISPRALAEAVVEFFKEDKP